MTKSELLLHFADDFGDWIDGDDPVEDSRYIRDLDQVWVKFESGAEFIVTVEQVYE